MTDKRRFPDPQELAIFLEVAKQRSFSQAALRLGVTTSSVSQSVTHLEKSLDAALVNRAHRPIELTCAGDRLYRKSGPILNELERTVRELKPAPGFYPEVRLGLSESVSGTLSPCLLQKIRTVSNRITVSTGFMNTLAKNFQNGEIDILISGRTFVTTFCGLANYQKLFHDGEVLKTFGNTLKYVVVTVPVGLFLSILIAALLNSKIKGTSIYRTLYFLPSVTMAAAVAMVWKWIYNEKMGILNSAIRALGGKGIGWLTDPKIALYSVMIVGLWMSVGYNMIILLAGMQGISKSYYEAAQIDGAGPIQLFFKVTIPLLTPTIFFVMITSIISGFQVFDVIYMMIGKTNPAYANTQTVVMLFYRQAFDYGYKGYAAAISILIFAVIMLVTVIQMIGQKKWVNYD